MSLFVEADPLEYDGEHPAEAPDPQFAVEISNELTARHYATLLIPVERADDDVVPVYGDVVVSCMLPLRFYQEIVETMLKKDGLLIMGCGLGWETVAGNLLYALGSQAVSLEAGASASRKKSLVVVLNARDEELVTLNDLLVELKWLNHTDQRCDNEPPLKVVGSAEMTGSARRKAVYAGGGLVSVSLRVLVVDLLSGIVAASDITGMFVLHAELVRETSNEAFIVNLYRDLNRWGFVKAVSDQPEAFTGFTPLATKVRTLNLTSVFLWPRFHVGVLSLLQKPDLGAVRTTVTEVKVRLLAKMQKIQLAIMSCLGACLQELKRHNPALDTDYWDMENVHDEHFVTRVRMSLDSQWHRISWTLKQLVHDLGTLKDLQTSLLRDDSLAYYQKVQGVVDANTKSLAAGTMNMATMSPWLMMDEATTIMSYSKERALGKVSVSDSHSSEYTLEELPKWDQLATLLDDIIYERSVNNAEGPVLVMCSSHRQALQLSAMLARVQKMESSGKRWFSSRSFMVAKLREYEAWQEITSLTKALNTELDTDETEELNTSKSFTRGSNAPRGKRRRVRGAAAVASVAQLHSGSQFDRTAGAVELEDDIVHRLELQLKKEPDEIEEMAPEFEHLERFKQVSIQVYNSLSDELLLSELCPSYIVLYEPNLSFVRRIEIYQATNTSSPAKVYFMYYGTSVEEQIYLLRIRKEKQAFTRLIREKAQLAKHFATEGDNYKFKLKKADVVNTRIAGGANFRTESDEMRVIVDTREYRSSLPNLLYRCGMKVVPCMLTVGDYVVTPKIVVERKAIPDLISSFKSGRLYQQCEQMFRHYETPTLLVEFDELKSFSFEPFAELRAPGHKAANPLLSKLLKMEVQLKITELLISFPKLKVIWSSSPYETAQIILELKAKLEEPDVEEALSKGVNPQISSVDGPPMLNDDAIDVLQTIPGINNVNYTTVIQRVKNIEELVSLPCSAFVDMLGQENGNKAFNFINHTM